MSLILNNPSYGTSDWDQIVKQNNDAIIAESNKKIDKPTNQTVQEGYLYQDASGLTKLVDNNDVMGKFKYTIIVDNGDDGTPNAIEYADDCVSFIEAKVDNLGDWANTKLITDYFKPCVISPGDGAPKYYLKQSNMLLKEDGTNAVLTGADGDVMIEVKKLYGKIINVGNKAKLSIMNYKEDSSCFCFNDIGGVEKDVVYRGVFKAGIFGSETAIMRSISNVVPLVNITRNIGRTYAKNRGASYCQNDVFILFLWQFMYLLLYKTRDSQSALGQGRTLSINMTASNTGWSLNKPFCWGDQGGVNGVKFLGVEDFYGNIWEWVDGVMLGNLTYKLTRYPSKYNDSGDGYEISSACGMTAAINNDKYVTKLKLTNDLGFLPTASSGSSSTYWCDNMWIADAVQVVFFGGGWNDAAAAGAFCWALAYVASDARSAVGSRLCRV